MQVLLVKFHDFKLKLAFVEFQSGLKRFNVHHLSN